MTDTRPRRGGEVPAGSAIRNPPSTILVVDDEPIIRDALTEFLTQEGFQVVACNSGEEALARAEERRFDAALCDMQLPGMDGLQLLERLRRISPDTFVLLITAYATVENAVEAFHRGAHDYLMKPIILDEVSAKIRRLRIHRELFLENQWLRRELNRTNERDRMIGDSPAMRGLFAMIRKLAPTRSTVLIVGESGSGKELVARAIHAGTPVGQTATPVGQTFLSASSAGRQECLPHRFIAINCSAIPHDLLENQLFGHRKGAFTGADRDSAGVFVHAAAGTVFLDEVAEMPLATQAKLLRAIEQKEILPVGANEPVRVEARILAATNKELMRAVEAGRFREDLYYRLNVVTVRVPPLREHREDIPALVEHFVAKHARDTGKRVHGVTHEAMRLLMACPWRGNVRELDNALQRAVILGDGPLITPADLPPDLAPVEDDPTLVDDLGEAIQRFEKQHIERILRRIPDKKEAAQHLGIGLSSLYRYIEKLGIETRPSEPEA